MGGQTLEAAITNMNHRDHLVLCGALSGFGVTPHGLGNLFELITKELSVEGFMKHLRNERCDEARDQLSTWLRQGVIQSSEHRLERIDNVCKTILELQRTDH